MKLTNKMNTSLEKMRKRVMKNNNGFINNNSEKERVDLRINLYQKNNEKINKYKDSKDVKRKQTYVDYEEEEEIQ